ncbi:uncharacterized protein [Procambarus clarkii]|uniref:uncharacterized protein isoform X2 n=1 Tax=Procambarus clarkii TaxID=6728 RepID=UPI001E670338|nr:uncharacterized protein LOC123760260 isoform X2 [Procambarus clarkii]
MQSRLCVVALLIAYVVVVARASWLEWAQADQHDSNEDGRGSEVEHMMEAVKTAFRELSSKRSTWYSKYHALATDAANNSAIITELLGISRIAMPIIWNAYIGSQLTERLQKLRPGNVRTFSPSAGHSSATQGLEMVSTDLTNHQDFTVEVILKLTEEASVGLRLMLEPEDGQELNRDDGDVLVDAHFNWQTTDSTSREVVLNDKYGGVWGPQEAVYGGPRWPSLVVGEKFQLSLIKKGECFSLFVRTGKDVYLQEPALTLPYTFCPQARRQSKMAREARRVTVVVDEDHIHAGELHLYSVLWY